MEIKKLKKFLKHANKLCVLLYFCGLFGLVAISHDDLSEKTYFSENALLPGLVKISINSLETDIRSFNHKCKSYSGNFADSIKKVLREIGLEAYEQQFQYRDNFIGEHSLKNGTNIYGIVRAKRGSSTEAILINVPMFKDGFNYASGVAIALAEQMKEEQFWAKDIVFLFTDQDAYGACAWVDSYHGMTSSHISANQLPARAGSIQSGLVLEMKNNGLSYVNLKLEGYNGQLPNLDLSNVAVRLLQIEQIPVALNHQFDQWPSSLYEQLEHRFTSTGRMMKHLMSGRASGNHGQFLRYNIETLTLEGVHIPQWHNYGMIRLEKVVAGICRSLNNLLERFHQSFFFYVLPSPRRYISIGMYMPFLGLVLLPAAIKGLSVLFEIIHGEKNESNVEEKEAKTQETEKESAKSIEAEGDQEIDRFLKEMKSPLIESDQKVIDMQISPWYEVSLLVIASHVAGVALFYSPLLTPVWSEMFAIPPELSMVLLMGFSYLMGMSLISYISITENSAKYLRMVSLFHLCILMGALSIMNFSFGFTSSIPMVLAAFFIKSSSDKTWYIYKFLVLLVSPLFLCGLLFSIDDFVLVYNEQATKQSWIYTVITALLYPLWLQFWGITCAAIRLEVR